jgi:aspartyl-tRNA(Asn)/glutamyl-tRNA(Gln) amidotransferase subunit C
VSVISRQDVEHVARLARLALTEEEKEIFADQLGDILAHINKLNELDTADVPPMAHVVSLRNVTRADERRPSWPQEQMLANAPVAQNGFFRVPRILEEE